MKAVLPSGPGGGEKKSFSRVFRSSRNVRPSVRSFDDQALEMSIDGLRQMAPELSASRTLSRGQICCLLVIVAMLLGGLVFDALAVLVAINAFLTSLYMIVFLYNLAWFRKLVARAPVVAVSDGEARGIAEHELPTYTVLVAAYQEAEVISETIAALDRLDYPPSLLEVKLLLEADDTATIAAAETALNGRQDVEIVRIPNVHPRTKPKACNYGLQLSSGELLTIFDAEDRPDPLQLRRAAVAFRRLDSSVACLQAKLFYHNASQNIITRWFSAEYVTWFATMLPALVELKAPIPLGGTSMHIRRESLESVGGWDPYNVTEDADLGARLHRFGFQVLVLDSITLEEANSDFINWIRQRTRWYKGYLQTWLVHMRRPVRLWQELGWAGFLGFNVVIGATPILALLNPIFWLLTLVWLLGKNDLVQALYPGWLYYPAMVSLILGNFLAIYRTVIGVRVTGYTGLIFTAFVLPAYWIMMSLAALRAAGQVLLSPSHWEKTVHGLYARDSEELPIAEL